MRYAMLRLNKPPTEKQYAMPRDFFHLRAQDDLIERRGAWVKLTGAYILSKVGPPTYADRSELAKAYVKLAPERLVWGSDWPHPTSKGVSQTLARGAGWAVPDPRFTLC